LVVDLDAMGSKRIFKVIYLLCKSLSSSTTELFFKEYNVVNFNLGQVERQLGVY
tara:strand:+ start:32678 stop:32839 length:162 start_codon:yes stop_codon:yes gene_type:complete